MKIENMGQIKGIEQVYIFGQSTVKLSIGQILVARIEQIQGDKVLLKNREGALFMALMQEELGLAEGDVVEVAASGGKGGYVLHLLDINKEAAGPAARQDIGDKLPGTMAMMKANPGLDPKSAAFLIENSIPDTPGNLTALSDIVRGGSGLGALLAGIFAGLDQTGESKGGQAAEAQAVASQSQTTDTTALTNRAMNTTPESETAISRETPAEAQQAQAGQPALPVSGGAADTPQNSAVKSNMQPLAGEGQAAGDMAGGKMQYAGQVRQAQELTGNPAPQQPELSAQPIISSGFFGNDSEKNAAVPAVKEQVFGGQEPKADAELYNKEQIASKIRDMFIKPDVQTGAQLKKTIADMPDNLNALKMMLKRFDKDNKDIFIQKADQALKQMELMSASKRFDYIQMPLLFKNAERTAELYVYRRKRKREPGEQGTAVLVALDTQNIGRVETLIKTEGNEISLEFRLERRDIQQEITGRAKGLAKALGDAGYRLKSLRIKGLETKTTVLNTEALPEDEGLKAGNVDVKI